MNHKNLPTVLITDYAWPDIELEKSILEAASCHVVAGPASPATAKDIEALVVQHLASKPPLKVGLDIFYKA